MAPLRGPRCGPFPFWGAFQPRKRADFPVIAGVETASPGGASQSAEHSRSRPRRRSHCPFPPRREEDGDEGQICFGLHAESEWRQARTRLADCGPAGRSAGFRRAVRGHSGQTASDGPWNARKPARQNDAAGTVWKAATCADERVAGTGSRPSKDPDEQAALWRAGQRGERSRAGWARHKRAGLAGRGVSSFVSAQLGAAEEPGEFEGGGVGGVGAVAGVAADVRSE